MIKKSGEHQLTVGVEEMAAVKNTAELNHSIESEKCAVPLDKPRQQQKVNSIIHEWLTDMWLLTTGEEMEVELSFRTKPNGRPLAIVCDGQMKLTESRPATLDALRAVGIEMS
jgi:hypothetical protein